MVNMMIAFLISIGESAGVCCFISGGGSEAGIRVLKSSVLTENTKDDCFNGRRVLRYSKVPTHRICFQFDLVTVQDR